MPEFFGLFIHDQSIRELKPPAGREGDLLKFLESPGLDPDEKQSDSAEQKGAIEFKFDDDLWPVVPCRFVYLLDQSIRRLCVTELGGVGKTKLLEELEYLTQEKYPDHLVMRINLDRLPDSVNQMLDDKRADNLAPLLIELAKTRLKEAFKRSNQQTESLPGSEDERTSVLHAWLLNYIRRGKFTLIIDAIDQLDDETAGRRCQDTLRQFLVFYPQIRCVIAGRPYAIRRVWNEIGLGELVTVVNDTADPERETENVTNQQAAQKPSRKPVWRFCIVEQFTTDSKDKVISQAERYLGKDVWNAVQQIGANELSLPRTLNELRKLATEQDTAALKKIRTASELYWIVQQKSIEASFKIHQAKHELKFGTGQITPVLGAVALQMLIWRDTGPLTRVSISNTGRIEDSTTRFLMDMETTGIAVRLRELDLNIELKSILQQLAEIDLPALRFDSYKASQGNIKHLEFTDATIRDFYAAYFAARYLDSLMDGAAATQIMAKLAQRQSKVYSYPASANFGDAYQRFWSLAVEMPIIVEDEPVSEHLSYARIVRQVLMSREQRRPTEIMYRAWPGLLQRAGYLQPEKFSETDLLAATNQVQDQVWKAVFAGAAFDTSCPVKALLFEFLSEYPRMYQAERDNKVEGVEGLVSWYELGFRDIPAGTFRYGDQGKEIREINNLFQLNAYQVTNDVYSLFDGHHWEAMKTGGKFGNSKSYSDDAKCPAINLNFFDAFMFAVWSGGRLPTEFEWEAACRGKIGKLNEPHTTYYFGDNENDTNEAAGLRRYGWYPANSDNKAHPVGSFATRPASLPESLSWIEHPYKLYDMHGNVREWCQNWYDEKTLRSRVLRGGSFGSLDAADLRCSYRFSDGPAVAYSNVGVRVARASLRKP